MVRGMSGDVLVYAPLCISIPVDRRLLPFAWGAPRREIREVPHVEDPKGDTGFAF